MVLTTEEHPKDANLPCRVVDLEMRHDATAREPLEAREQLWARASAVRVLGKRRHEGLDAVEPMLDPRQGFVDAVAERPVRLEQKIGQRLQVTIGLERTPDPIGRYAPCAWRRAWRGCAPGLQPGLGGQRHMPHTNGIGEPADDRSECLNTTDIPRQRPRSRLRCCRVVRCLRHVLAVMPAAPSSADHNSGLAYSLFSISGSTQLRSKYGSSGPYSRR